MNNLKLVLPTPINTKKERNLDIKGDKSLGKYFRLALPENYIKKDNPKYAFYFWLWIFLEM